MQRKIRVLIGELDPGLVAAIEDWIVANGKSGPSRTTLITMAVPVERAALAHETLRTTTQGIGTAFAWNPNDADVEARRVAMLREQSTYSTGPAAAERWQAPAPKEQS